MNQPLPEWMKGIQERDLPDSLREIACVVGREAALRLALKSGGFRVVVPSSASPDHPLAAILGAEKLAALMEHFAGEQLYIPALHSLQRQARNREVRAARARGMTVQSLARRHGLSEGQIHKILKGARP